MLCRSVERDYLILTALRLTKDEKHADSLNPVQRDYLILTEGWCAYLDVPGTLS